MEVILAILFLIFACIICWAVGAAAPGTWAEFWAKAAAEKISLEVTGYKIDVDALVATMVIKNEDWIPHEVCVIGGGYMIPDMDDYDIGVRWHGGIKFDDPVNTVCVEISEHSSQTVVAGAHQYSQRNEATDILVSGSYEGIEACGRVVEIDDIRRLGFRGPIRENEDGYWYEDYEQCVLYSGP